MKDKEYRIKTPPSQTQMLDGPASAPHTPKSEFSSQPHTPKGTPPDLPCTNPMKISILTDAPTKLLATDIATEILQGVKEHSHLKVEKEFEEKFTSKAAKLLEHKKMVAHNGLHYVETCKDSNHFQEIFIAHMVEKLVKILGAKPDWSPTPKNIENLIGKVDEALKSEDEFHLDKGVFVSWREPEAEESTRTPSDEDKVPPLPYEEIWEQAAATIPPPVPPLGESTSNGTTTTAEASTDSLAGVFNLEMPE